MKIINIILFFYTLSLFASPLSQEKRMTKNMIMFSDVVYKIKSTTSNTKIMFAKHSAIYYLNAENKNYNQIKDVIEQSMQQHKKITVQVEPDSMQIQSAN